MSVASTTRRRPGGDGASAWSCSSSASAPASRCTSTPGPRSSCSAIRLISPMPGRNTSTSPSSSRSARRTAEPTAASRRSSRDRGSQRTSTGNVRPALSTIGAGTPSIASRRANSAVSAVADIARMRRSGRSVAAASSVNARPRSVVRLRSWTSSKITAADAGQLGILLQAAGQHTLGEHLDPGGRPDAPLVAGLVADEVADGGAGQSTPSAGPRPESPAAAARASRSGARPATARRAGRAGRPSSCRRRVARPRRPGRGRRGRRAARRGSRRSGGQGARGRAARGPVSAERR